MRAAAQGIVWIGVFLGVCVAPLTFALMAATHPGQGFWTDFSVALGFVGLALMGIEFALVARVRAIAEPFGTDAVIQFHREIGYVGLAFVLTHTALSGPGVFAAFSPAELPWRARFAVLSVLALLILMVTSVWRRRLRLSYEVWQVLHAITATVAVIAALVHVLLVNHYIDSLWKQALWAIMSAAFVGLLAWIRILRPVRLLRRPWVVERVIPERGRTTVLVLRPHGHDGLRFQPGQFAWITVGRSPFSVTSHPFSLASSAETGDTLTFAIKALGDFTAGVREVRPGTTVYVDGPHGVFSIDQYEGAGFCLIAGGVGVVPALSMLRTLADRGDLRPVVLFSAHRDWDGITFREDVDELAARLNLRVVRVLEHPPPGWTGERGHIDADLLRRHLPDVNPRFQFFVCGPNPMIDAMEAAIPRIGVPPERIHTERFAWV
ncbi:oxidoreductase [Nonomuraea sp. NN258]|uniref:ferredoxin reductase family protein n=1 Tax=Nonomuraea antri TaxID=2730852 RepID=UPI0015689697|nr:ferric reductase-like transmembrane domain-containing protein [Nonomuraea antri]NRQ34677.1 oxidoreductase [Nonomuraea antri]